MFRSSDYRFGLLAGLFSLLSCLVFSQSISYQNPDGLSVCGSAPMEVTVNNTTGNVLQNVTVAVEFTTSAGTDCGIQYAPGSVSGAQEGNISNLSAPVFQLQNIAGGATVTFTINLEAPCSVGNCIDNAEFFVNEITLNYTGGSTSITTDPYEIATALLVITQVNSYVMGGVKGDVLQRKITIVNTRPAPLSSFIFTDTHQGGIEITSNQGNDISPGGNVFQLEIGGSDFAAVGDGDQLLELNESIVITENILITDCGVDISSTVSNINLGWGCNGEICQQTTVNAIVTIAESPSLPVLLWEPITSVPECFCGDRPYQQGMVITNAGNGTATDIVLDLFQASPVGGGMDTASFAADSLGLPIGLSLLGEGANTPPAPCTGPPVSSNVSVLLQSLQPGASITLTWDVYFCDQSCNQPAVFWQYKYSYFKECPPDPFIFTNDWISVNDSGLGMAVMLGDNATGPLEDDSTYTITYTLNYDSLTLLDDELLLEIALPCGMNWDPANELILNGQAPGSISFDQGSEFLTITASYQLPLNANMGTTSFDFTWNCEDLCFESQICIDSVESTCPALLTCTAPPVNIIGFDVNTTILKCGDYPPGCNLQNCASKGIVHQCPVDSLCINAPPGYIAYDFEAFRANYGLPDNDNDQLADAAGQLDMGLIRKDRAMAGDTLHASMKGVVRVDVTGTTFPFALAEIAFLGSHYSVQNQEAMLSETGIVPVGGVVRIFDSSASVWYNCTAPVPVPTDDARIIYTYDISPANLGGCGLPAGFQLAQGDSVHFEADYRINYNMLLETDADPLLGWVAMQPKFLVYGPDTALYEPLNCGCDFQNFEVSGYQYNLLPGNFALPPCSPMANFVSGTLIDLRLHERNFFPYEYRNLLTVEDLKLKLPNDVALLQSRLNFIRYQNATSNLVSNVTLSPTFSNGFFHFDLESFQVPPIEEGFSIFMQYLFDGECDIPGAVPLTATATLDFVPGLPVPSDPLEITVTANALRPLTPILSAEAPICDLISFNNQLVLDFNFINFQTIVASQMSGPSPNTWMYFTSPTGKVTDFQIIDLTTNLPLPSINGVFQFGNYPVGLKPFRLVATNNSCSLENVEMHFGWHCTPFTSPVQDPCYENVKLLTILSPPGEIDMLVEPPAGGCTDLCDTIPYHQVEVFNAQLGSVYDLLVTVLLPPGFEILAGSSQVEYPSGSGIFYPIGDPIFPNSAAAQWDLTALVDSLANGLPGVGSAPANSVTLYFLGETTCDFIADAYPLFVASAKQNCGTPSNTVAKPGGPLCINGVSAPFSTNINVTAAPGFACNDEVSFNVSMTSNGTLPPGACAIVTLPPGISFVPNSCASACQGNFNCNPSIDGNTLTWQLPAGVPPNQIVCFNFATTGWGNVGCESGALLFRSALEANALCALTGDTCSAKVSTGAIVFPYQPMRPSFDLSAFMVNASQVGSSSQVDFSINITNNGFPNEPPITLGFYLDTDGNGSGDQLVHTENILETLSNGASTTSSGSFAVPEGSLCQLIAYLDPAVQCACAGDSTAVLFPINYQTAQMPTVCSGADVTIGVPEMPGFSYQWEPAGCIQDAGAASTVFNCANDGASPVLYDLVLVATNGSCTVNNQLSVTVQPVPGIALAEDLICEGETANLVATDGVSFNWQGPGITQPNLQIQTVMPGSTSEYSVTVTDAFNCAGTESVTITVNPLPTADAGPDAMFCGNELAQLNALCDGDYSYLWSPAFVNGLPALSNPSVCDPVVLTNTSTLFTLTVTDENGCSASDEAAIGFGSNLELTLTPDFTICAGSTRLLEAVATGASGPVSFSWTPAGDCQNPACSVISVAPLSTTNYTVEATDEDGCAASASVTVSVTTDTIFTAEAITICEGGTALIFGNETSQAGLYSQTYNLLEGCDSTHTIELAVLPGMSDTTFQSICQGDTIEFLGINYTESGVYCTGNSSSPCDSTCLNLVVLDTPSVAISVLPLADTTISPGDTALLMIDSLPFESIVWADSAGVLLEECSGQFSCWVVPEASTFYTVSVTGENGCTGTALQRINVRLECEPGEAQVPSAFSPNRDDTNDFFDIVAPNAERVSWMKVWDRWGEKVYEGIGPWDGRYKDKDALPDVYIYLIRVGCPDGIEKEEKILKGDVTLLR